MACTILQVIEREEREKKRLWDNFHLEYVCSLVRRDSCLTEVDQCIHMTQGIVHLSTEMNAL